MAPTKPAKRGGASKGPGSSRFRVSKAGKKKKASRPRRRRHHQTRPWTPRRLPPVNENERNGMFASMVHFLQNDPSKANEISRMLQSSQPVLFHKICAREKFQAADLTDDSVRGVSQIIYERAARADDDIDIPLPPQQHVTSEMRRFIDEYTPRLSPAHFEQLQGIIRATVPCMYLVGPEEARTWAPSRLPENVQIMISKYLQKHLPDEVKAEMADEKADEGYDGEEEDSDDDMDSDIDTNMEMEVDE